MLRPTFRGKLGCGCKPHQAVEVVRHDDEGTKVNVAEMLGQGLPSLGDEASHWSEDDGVPNDLPK